MGKSKRARLLWRRKTTGEQKNSLQAARGSIRRASPNEALIGRRDPFELIRVAVVN